MQDDKSVELPSLAEATVIAQHDTEACFDAVHEDVQVRNLVWREWLHALVRVQGQVPRVKAVLGAHFFRRLAVAVSLPTPCPASSFA